MSPVGLLAAAQNSQRQNVTKGTLMLTVPSQGPPIRPRVLDPAAKIDPLKAGYRDNTEL